MNSHTETSDWKCRLCGKLLGKRQGNRIYIKMKHGNNYSVRGIVDSDCPTCGTANSVETAKIAAQSN